MNMLHCPPKPYPLGFFIGSAGLSHEVNWAREYNVLCKNDERKSCIKGRTNLKSHWHKISDWP